MSGSGSEGRHEPGRVLRQSGGGLAPGLGVPRGTLLRLLVAREEESSTVLTPHLAIPHVIIEDSRPFGILMVRCRPGVNFGEDAAEVHAVIVLAGPLQERNFHLRCLAAIAQVVQTADFEERWLAAPGEQALRDLFVLSRRHREQSAHETGDDT